jgi:hypothetical protein
VLGIGATAWIGRQGETRFATTACLAEEGEELFLLELCRTGE